MNYKKIFLSLLLIVTFGANAQNLTATYVQLADSADRYIKKKMWPDAERVIIKALKHEPANKSNFLLWSNLGIVRENLEDFKGAVEAYTIGLSSAPKSTVLLTNRARSYIALNERDEALKDLDTVLALDSTLQWPLKMRGLIHATQGEYSAAMEDLKKYNEKYGADASVLEAMGDIYSKRGDSEKTLEAYKEAYKQEPDDTLLVKLLLTAYAYGKIEDMADEINDGIKKYHHNGTLYLMRAMLNKARYQNDAYESDLKSALNLGVDKELFEYMTKRR